MGNDLERLRMAEELDCWPAVEMVEYDQGQVRQTSNRGSNGQKMCISGCLSVVFWFLF